MKKIEEKPFWDRDDVKLTSANLKIIDMQKDIETLLSCLLLNKPFNETRLQYFQNKYPNILNRIVVQKIFEERQK